MNHNQFPGDQDMAEDAARVAEEARGQALRAAGKANREAQEVLDQASAGFARLEGRDSAAPMNERINQGIKAAGQQIGGLAEQLRQRAPEGQGGEVAQRAATLLDQGAGYLQGADADTIRSDLERLIRRNPLPALGLGVALGFVLGRSLKG